MKKDVRLYNVLFPVWLLLMVPRFWLVVIPGNILVDSLVLILGMKAMKLPDRRERFKRHIVPVVCFGFLADLLASGMMFALMALGWGGAYGDSLLLTVPGVVLAAVLIYGLNVKFTFRTWDNHQRKQMALIFAVATAPYTFLIPTRCIYGF